MYTNSHTVHSTHMLKGTREKGKEKKKNYYSFLLFSVERTEEKNKKILTGNLYGMSLSRLQLYAISLYICII